MYQIKRLSAFILAMSLVACGDKPANQPSTSEPKTTTTPRTNPNAPVYRVGTMVGYVPYGLIDENGQISGLDIDILQAVAKNQGFNLELRSMPWDLMPNALNGQEVDIIANGLARDDFPQDTITSTDSYLQSPDCIWAKDKAKLANWQQGTIAMPEVADMAEELAEQFGIKQSQLVIDKMEFGSLQSLIHDKADVVISDCVALDYFGKRDEFKTYNFEKMIVPNSDNPINSHLVFMVRAGDDELLQKINMGLSNLRKSGELAQIEARWH